MKRLAILAVAVVAAAVGAALVGRGADAAKPPPAPQTVREQNLDANGNIKTHEQGTANVNVTNGSLSVAPQRPVTDGANTLTLHGNISDTFAPFTASALSIHMTAGVTSVLFKYQNGLAAFFPGPAEGGNDTIVLALSRPITFDSVGCGGIHDDDICSIGWVGNEP